MSDYDREKLSYQQYNKANVAQFLTDYTVRPFGKNDGGSSSDLQKTVKFQDPSDDVHAYNNKSLDDL